MCYSRGPSLFTLLSLPLPVDIPMSQSKGKTEEQLLAQDSISKDDVMRLTKATDNYLCKPSANSFGATFNMIFRLWPNARVVVRIMTPSNNRGATADPCRMMPQYIPTEPHYRPLRHTRHQCVTAITTWR